MDEVTWAALTAVLTALGAAWTWYAFRHRGAASGLRGAGLTLLPPAAWLTGTLEMFTEIGGSVLDWATDLALSPKVWVGIVVSGIAVLLLMVSGVLRERALGKDVDPDPKRRDAKKPAEGSARRDALPPSSGQPDSPLTGDDDLSEVEEILRRRGIN